MLFIYSYYCTLQKIPRVGMWRNQKQRRLESSLFAVSSFPQSRVVLQFDTHKTSHALLYIFLSGHAISCAQGTVLELGKTKKLTFFITEHSKGKMLHEYNAVKTWTLAWPNVNGSQNITTKISFPPLSVRLLTVSCCAIRNKQEHTIYIQNLNALFTERRIRYRTCGLKRSLVEPTNKLDSTISDGNKPHSTILD